MNSTLPASAATSRDDSTTFVEPAATPNWIDFFFIFIGFALSLLLTEFADMRVDTDDAADWMTAELSRIIPYLFFVPAGIILWWPLFAATGRMRGRRGNLTLVEKVWGLLWLLDLLFVGVILWYHFHGLPEAALAAEWKGLIALSTRLVVWGAGAIAFVSALWSLRRRVARPWTHHFGLALLMWPVAPQLLLWMGRLRLVFFVGE